MSLGTRLACAGLLAVLLVCPADAYPPSEHSTLVAAVRPAGEAGPDVPDASNVAVSYKALAPQKELPAHSWFFDSRVGEHKGCPDGQRNALISECYAAVKEAAKAKGQTHLKGIRVVDVGVEKSGRGSVPSGCSYQKSSEMALFNRNPAGRSSRLCTLVCAEGALSKKAEAEANSKDPRNQQLWWLHIPKCGSSFETSCHLYERDPGIEGGPHHPLEKDVKLNHVKHVVAMFRAPKQQRASMYYYLQRDVKILAGPCDEPNKCGDLTGPGGVGHPLFYGGGHAWGWSPHVEYPVRRAIYQNKSIASTLGDFDACQANMVLGARCLSQHDWGMSSEAIVHKAWQRVQEFRFVGLEGSWNLSICLFNYLMTGVRYVSRGQLVDNRPTSGTGATEYDETGVPDDPVDGPLYDKIATRFAKQLKEHRISPENCPDVTDWEQGTLPTINEDTATRVPLAVGPLHNSTDDPTTRDIGELEVRGETLSAASMKGAPALREAKGARSDRRDEPAPKESH